MKCKNCGGQYRWYERKCPYCDETNLAGRIWMDERSAAERLYAKKMEAAGRRVSPYVINRALTRILLLLILLLVVVFAAAVLVEELSYRTGRSSLMKVSEAEPLAEQYLEKGEYGKLYRLLSDNSLFGEDFADDRMAAAAFLGSDYAFFLQEKESFLSLDEKERSSSYSDYRLRYILSEAWDVVNLDAGSAGSVGQEELPAYEEYAREVHAALLCWFGFTEEEYAAFMSSERPSEEMLAEYVGRIRTRCGWEVSGEEQ